jgi:hypothetical protein
VYDKPNCQNISKEEKIAHHTGTGVAVLLSASEMNKRERYRAKGML